MKIRLGFVSNSSSSSFCIYGAIVDCSVITTDDDEDLEEVVEKKLMEHGLGDILYLISTDDDYYLGGDWCCIGDRQTGAEFKKEIEDAIEKVCGKKMTCSTHEEAWYG